MRRARSRLLLTVVVIALGACGSGGGGAAPLPPPAGQPAQPAPGAAPAPAPAGPLEDPPSDPAGTLAGLRLPDVTGVRYIQPPPQVTDGLATLQTQASGQVRDIGVRGLTSRGQELGVLLVTRYSGTDIRGATFRDGQRERISSRGAQPAERRIGGQQVLSSAIEGETFLSWAQGTDTVVVLGGTDVAQLEQVAAGLIATNR